MIYVRGTLSIDGEHRASQVGARLLIFQWQLRQLIGRSRNEQQSLRGLVGFRTR